MRKGNYTAYVKQNTPSVKAVTEANGIHCPAISRLSVSWRIDTLGAMAYLGLHTAHESLRYDAAPPPLQAGSPGPPQRPQSSTTSRTGQPVSHHPLLRSRGFGPSALRNASASPGRQSAHQRGGRLVWGNAPNLLQSPKGSCGTWPCWTHTAAEGPKNAPQALGRSLGLCRPSSDRTPRYHTRPVRRGHWHKIWHCGTPAQLGTRFSKQKKTARQSVASDPAALLNAYEQLRAVALGARPACGAGLATLYRQGVAAWIRSASPLPITPLPAAQPIPSAARADVPNEVTLILANLVATLITENAYA